jgi:hypothetical protein
MIGSSKYGSPGPLSPFGYLASAYLKRASSVSLGATSGSPSNPGILSPWHVVGATESVKKKLKRREFDTRRDRICQLKDGNRGGDFEMHGTRERWLAFACIPLLLVGIASSLWLIVRGAWA